MASNHEIPGLKDLGQAAPRPAPTGFKKDKVDDAVRDLITTYHSLNPTTIDELSEEPSALEFMRYVSRNRPFVVRKGAEAWKARQKWNANYLSNVMGSESVNVAITPYGNADSVISPTTQDSDTSQMIFVKPYETSLPFSAVLKQIQEQELAASDHPSFSGSSSQPSSAWPTRYLQTQNDNLRNEYNTIFSDVPPSIPFARIALAQDPDAINFWLGNSYSTTALHKDNYENVYVQILGKKHFVLLPPIEAPCVGEKSVLAATYRVHRNSDDGTAAIAADDVERSADLIATVDDPVEYVPFATWDPDYPERNATPYSRYSQPLRVTLDEGDMLYLPALWYHKVSQSCSEEGVCCAVNYWYDLDFSGGFWSMASFVRGVGLLSLNRLGGENVNGLVEKNEVEEQEGEE
ncbi:Clavaminate synthase-like protein [Periconia macrospinosa]|uniref:Clavaminate synthase-like protein n=1 Tax=Periconia macrospinosa TaxID=97972 RepID=A0A2V1E6A8_9PLEO|nr:Clavaminate synthase-like protein [Periconia macrospinosa]